MTKLSERMLRDLHVGIGDIVLSDIINEASALEESRDWWKDKAGQHKARANNLEHDFDVMRHAKQDRIDELEEDLAIAREIAKAKDIDLDESIASTRRLRSKEE